MSVEDRLRQMEERLSRLEGSYGLQVEGYKRLLNGFQKILGDDIEEDAEDRDGRPGS